MSYDYRDDGVYKIMVLMATEAGMKVTYTDDMPEDIHARQRDGNIQMPTDPEAFPDDGETASIILGHEIGHYISDLETDDRSEFAHFKNEAVCDLIGVYLLRLAEKIYDHNSRPVD